MSDKEIERYKRALREIIRKDKETNGCFCNGYFAVVAKEYGVKVRPLKQLFAKYKLTEEA